MRRDEFGLGFPRSPGSPFWQASCPLPGSHETRILHQCLARNRCDCGGEYCLSIDQNKGLKGAFFGARISGTVGDLELGRTGPISTTLQLHRLEAPEPGAPRVGIEVANRSIASYRRLPIRLTSEPATVLNELLAQAIAAG